MKGAVAPGYAADLILLDNLENFSISTVYKDGILVGKNGAYAGPLTKGVPVNKVINTVNIADYTNDTLEIRVAKSTKANIIGIKPNSIVTVHLVEEVEVSNGLFVPSVENDMLKIAVFERHKASGNIGLGIVKGFGLKRGLLPPQLPMIRITSLLSEPIIKTFYKQFMLFKK